MQSLNERQSDFAAAILNPKLPTPSGLIDPDGDPSSRRFAIYRNNVVVGLCESLKANFPVVSRLVGEDFFLAMARAYVLHEPPHSPIMADYGSGFPDFIGSFEPAAGLAYLADVARLERAWTEAYYAAESAPLDPNVLRTVNPDAFAGMRLKLHPSLRVMQSSFPVLSIWLTNIDGGTPSSVNLTDNGQDIFLVRPETDVETRLLPLGGAAFLRALIDGSTVLAAMKPALRCDRHFDLVGFLSVIFAAGMIVDFSTSEKSLGTVLHERV